MRLTLKNLADKKAAWGLLFISALGFELAALYFQFGLELLPCIMCIYQRTAVFGIMFSAVPAMILNNIFTRIIGFTGWGISAIWGLFIAIEHVTIQKATNPFFATCEIVPNFPSWAPLHEWIPDIFAATGDCGDIDWSFMDMSMPQWMMIIFGIYTLLLIVVLNIRVISKKSL